MITAKALMRKAVKMIGPDATLVELDRALLAARVGGFPVVDDAGRLVGIVSRSDVVRQLGVEQALAEVVSDYYRDVNAYEPAPAKSLAEIAAQVGQRIERLRVRDVMIGNLITVPPETLLADLARIFVERNIHRLPVVERGRLVGIVTTLDLVRLFAEDKAVVVENGPEI